MYEPLVFSSFIFFIIFMIPNIYLFQLITNLFSFFLYHSNYRKQIVEFNLKKVFPDINQKKIDLIRYGSCKILIYNILIFFNILLFGCSGLERYYKKKIKFDKSIVCCSHFGIFYDGPSIAYHTQKSTIAVYKSKGLPFNIKCRNNLMHFIKHNDVKKNKEILFNYNTILVPIDQKAPLHASSEVSFLNQKIRIHNYLIKKGIEKNRSIYFGWIDYPENSKYFNYNYFKIETKNKTIDEVCQSISNCISNIIRKNPEQYLWFHNRFSGEKYK